ncbi:MAG TPA: class I SAM-dependent methyltransferase [Burkholderiales bacterium]|nr:class I SAM-dependent methyltransferase [Burkholderiales bacterium]
MPIDFHQPQHRNTYATRDADNTWAEAMRAIAAPHGALAQQRVADIGCGGGIYSLAWHALGVAGVTGVDFSAAMVAAARDKAAGQSGISFQQGEATASGLPAAGADIVFERALIHHLQDYAACFAEARRVLGAGGLFIVQDRTPEDVALPGAPDHLRGYFFECFPRLLQVEAGRRPPRARVEQALRVAGFTQVQSQTLWEVRKTYTGFAPLEQDLAARTGRSILHELSDAELRELIAHIRARLPAAAPIVEKDRWTVWTGVKQP